MAWSVARLDAGRMTSYSIRTLADKLVQELANDYTLTLKQRQGRAEVIQQLLLELAARAAQAQLFQQTQGTLSS